MSEGIPGWKLFAVIVYSSTLDILNKLDISSIVKSSEDSASVFEKVNVPNPSNPLKELLLDRSFTSLKISFFNPSSSPPSSILGSEEFVWSILIVAVIVSWGRLKLRLFSLGLILGFSFKYPSNVTVWNIWWVSPPEPVSAA